MSIFAALGTGLRVEPEDRRPQTFAPGELDQLGYWMLMRIHDIAPNGESVRYTDTLPDIDEFELRAAANWLVVTGYARWVTGTSIALTDEGRGAAGTIVELHTAREADVTAPIRPALAEISKHPAGG